MHSNKRIYAEFFCFICCQFSLALLLINRWENLKNAFIKLKLQKVYLQPLLKYHTLPEELLLCRMWYAITWRRCVTVQKRRKNRLKTLCWQCWVSYFLKVTCYSYKLLHEKSNLLQLLLHFKSNKLLYKLLYRYFITSLKLQSL